MPLDPLRFIYSLAGAMLGGDWTAATITAAMRVPPVDRPPRVPKLADRIITAFPAKPDFNSLVIFLQKDAGLARAFTRATFSLPLRPIRRGKPEAKPKWLAAVALPEFLTESSLADWFGTDPQHLRWRADITGRNRKHRHGPFRTYRHRWIPKREGVPRLLEIPKRELKQMQRKILTEILDRIPAHLTAHGFRAGRSIVTNAAPHCGKPTVLRFDLIDFFPSVTAARVFRIFRTVGYPADIARLLMGRCTTSLPADVWESRPGGRDGADFLNRQRLIGRHLPQGAPTSPGLANLAATRLDRRLHSLASKIGAVYTRYADDLTFSGDADLARSRKRLGTLVAVIAEDEGFSLNHRKTRIMRSGKRQHVTGIVVNAHPNIGRAEFDRLKAILTNCIRHGPASQNREGISDFRAYLAGKVSHVRSVNPARCEKLVRLLDQILWPDCPA
jgi:RNA-directed DNA polymerase